MALSHLPVCGDDERSNRPRFHAPSHVMAQFSGRNLSLAARLLALALACKARKASDGHFYVWRGREALSKLTGLSERSVTAARQELVESGLFLATYTSSIETPDGVFDVTRGVPVLQLVENPEAFVVARENARASDRRIVDAETHSERLEIQKRHLGGQITIEQCRQREAEVRRRYRRERCAWGEAASPKGLTLCGASNLGRKLSGGEGASREGVKQLHPGEVKQLHPVG